MKVSAFTIVLLVFTSVAARGQEMLKPYVFEKKGSDDAVYGLADPKDVESGISVKVQIDEPWDRSSRIETYYKREIEEPTEMSEVSYKAYLNQKWAESGRGEEIETASGKRWVHKTDLRLAQRALDESKQDTAEAASTPEIVETVDAIPEAGQTQGGLGHWWLHGVIVLGAGFSAFLIVWWGFVRRSWSAL